MTNPLTHSQTPKKALLRGAAWTVGARWLIKLVGFVNTMIVARLVEPQDYGVIAMAFLVVALAQAFLDFGASTALLRKETISRDEIDSAWTLTAIQGLLTGLLVFSCAPLAGSYFEEPKLIAVLWVLAGCLSLSGLTNVGLTVAQKNLQFSVDFKYMVSIKIFGVVTTVVAAFFWRDYRALLVGVVMGYVAGLVLSYGIHPYRPRWNTSRIPEIWAVTKWLMIAGVGGFFLRKSDELIAGRIGTTSEFGVYNVGADVGQLPTGELGPAMLRAFLPVLSTIQADVKRTNQAVLKTLSAVNTITLPVGLGFAAIATPATALLLGPQWLQATPFVACFALAGALQFAMSPLNTLLVLRGHTRTQNHIVWIEFVCFAAMALLLVPQMHLLGLVWARISASLVNAMVTAAFTHKHCKLPLGSIAGALWRPLVGSIGMYLLVDHLIGLLGTSATQMTSGIALGAMLFGIWTGLTWLLAGRPEGLESTVFDYFAIRSAPKHPGD